MTRRNSGPDQRPGATDPFGISKFSPRRSTVQITLCLVLIIGLLTWATIHAALTSNPTAIAIPAAALAVALVMIGILMRASIRTVQGEIWIRRMGMGDLEYRVEPTGNDEITKALEALETLRQSSLQAMQLDRVRLLSQELRQKNAELESTLEKLRSTQDRIISQQKLAELGELSAGVTHEIRNPLQFIKNFTISSELLISELKDPVGATRRVKRGGSQRSHPGHLRESGTSDSPQRLGQWDSVGDADPGPGNRRGIPPCRPQPVGDRTDRPGPWSRTSPGTGVQHPSEHRNGPRPGRDYPGTRGHSQSDRQPRHQRLPSNGREGPGACENYMPELLVRTSGTGDAVTITVLDNGPGVTPEIVRRMFIPFFTTRDTALNTGLGLSLAHDIAREHRGRHRGKV